MPILNPNPHPQGPLHIRLCRPHVRIHPARPSRLLLGRSRNGLPRQHRKRPVQPHHPVFNLIPLQVLGDHFFRNLLDVLFVLQPQNLSSIAKAKPVLQHVAHHLLWKPQQPHVIRNRFPRHSDPVRNLRLRQVKLRAQHPERLRLLDAVQILPRHVLQHRHLRRLLRRKPTHQRWDRVLPRHLRSPQPPLAENKDVTPFLFSRTHHHWLHHPMFLNRVPKLLQHLLIKHIPSLVRILLNQLNGNIRHHVGWHSLSPNRDNFGHLLVWHWLGDCRLVWGGRCCPPCLDRRRSRRFQSAHHRPVAPLIPPPKSLVIPNKVRNLLLAAVTTALDGTTTTARRRHNPRPRQQRLQSPTQSPPVLHLLLFLLHHRMPRQILRRRSRSHQIFPSQSCHPDRSICLRKSAST